MFDSLELSKPVARYVADVLREKDRDLYLCSLFAPVHARNAIMALYAFNAEITITRKSFDEPMVRQIRLKWWFDALAGVFAGAPAHHPVLELLAEVVPLGLKRHILEFLIEAEVAKFEDEDGIKTRTRWTLLFLQALDILGARGYKTDKAAENAAKAWGALTKLRQNPENSTDVIADHNMISAYRAAIPEITGVAVPALLPIVLTDIYLERIKCGGYNMGHPIVRRSDPGVMGLLRLWGAVKRRRI